MKNCEDRDTAKTCTLSSNICLNPLQDNATRSSLKTLIFITDSCIGPFGKLKLMQHESGGCVTVTSSSQRLFQQLSVKNIITKSVVATSKTQLRNFNDGGLYCALLVLKLVYNVSLNEYPFSIIGCLYDYFAHHYLNCLNIEINKCVQSIDFSNLKHLKSLVITLLSSKPSCILTLLQKNHLCSLLLKAFLSAAPLSCSVFNNFGLHILTVNGICPLDSKMFNGILVPINKVEANYALTEWKYADFKGELKIALFTVSLAGDVSMPTGNIELSASFSYLEITRECLDKLSKTLISDSVHVVLCQKVIHPKFKRQLQRSGILVLERIGSETTNKLCDILGGSYNSSLVSKVVYGFASNISFEKNGDHNFMLIGSEKFPSFSFLIGHYNEEAVVELQVVCRQAISSFVNVLKSGKVCYGGGCLEVHTLHLLKKRIADEKDGMSKITDNQGLAQVAFDTFVKSVLDVCASMHKRSNLDLATENVYGHLWTLTEGEYPSGSDTCACGTYSVSTVGDSSWMHVSDFKNSKELACIEGISVPSVENIVLDEFSCKKNAMALAFEMASSLLRTTVLVNNMC